MRCYMRDLILPLLCHEGEKKYAFVERVSKSKNCQYRVYCGSSNIKKENYSFICHNQKGRRLMSKIDLVRKGNPQIIGHVIASGVCNA